MNANGTNSVPLTENSTNDLMPDWSPDGSKIVYISQTQGGKIELFTLDVNSLAVNRLTDYGQYITNPKWSPDGQKIAFSAALEDSNVDIYVTDINGSQRKRLTTTPEVEEEPTWSPDGKFIMFTAEQKGRGQLFVITVDGTSSKQILKNDFSNQQAEWFR